MIRFLKSLADHMLSLVDNRKVKFLGYSKLSSLKKCGKYSQLGQDTFVYNTFFKGKKDGIFCDVGGNHPTNINNTFFFEELGWSGFAFEPLPKMKNLWEKHRKALFFNHGVSDTEKMMKFASLRKYDWDSNGELSFVVGDKEVLQDDYQESEIISVLFRPLKDVFSENNVSHINYMSIDTEGHDLEVLRGIDFKAVKIDVMTVENNDGLFLGFGSRKVRKFLRKKGFVFYARIMFLDDVYVRKDFLHQMEPK